MKQDRALVLSARGSACWHAAPAAVAAGIGSRWALVLQHLEAVKTGPVAEIVDRLQRQDVAAGSGHSSHLVAEGLALLLLLLLAVAASPVESLLMLKLGDAEC